MMFLATSGHLWLQNGYANVVILPMVREPGRGDAFREGKKYLA